MDTTSKNITIKAGTPATLTFTNRAKGALEIQKFDAVTSKPLAGAVFRVTEQNGALVGEFTTDQTGLAAIPQMKTGWYVITEVKCPDGYILDSTPQTVEMKTGAPVKVVFTNKPVTGLVIKKIDADSRKALKGAVFTITRADGKRVGEYTTDENGLITIPSIEPGDYLITEVRSPEGYIIDTESKPLTIRAGEPASIQFTNKAKSSILIQKIDPKGKGLAGAVFSVKMQNGKHIGDFTTDTSGLISIPNAEPGVYVIVETKAPEGYILDSTPQTVQVTAGEPAKVIFTNNAVSGLQIQKVVAQTGKPIKNVTFKITRQNGEVVGEYKTDENGMIFVDLEPGTYTVTELRAPDGIEVDRTPRTVVVKPNVPTVLTIENTQLSGLRIRKIDSDTGAGIYGVRILLKDENRKIIGEYITDQDGYIELDKELVDGTYTLEEIAAAPGYDLDKTVKTIHIKNGKTTEVIWENATTKGQIQIIKKSANDNPMTNLPAGSLLEGAVFEIAREDSNVVVDHIVTDYRGMAASKPLPVGRYIVREGWRSPVLPNQPEGNSGTDQNHKRHCAH